MPSPTLCRGLSMKCASSLLLLLFGCGYQSQYVAPSDGRARVLWNDDHLVTNLDSLPRTQDCHEATWWLRHPAERIDRRLTLAPVVWVPRYYGPDIVVINAGVPPILPRPVLFSPSLTVAHALATSTPRAPSGRLDKELAAILMVIAIVVLPIVDVTFAALQPESDSRSADAIDEVNAFNDLARSGGNPCTQ
jgi:hypothetical protein